MQIIKRDGTKVPFDKQKIINAINGAIKEVYGTLENDIKTAEDIADIIETYAKARELADKKPLTVEDIQDTVEDLLMDSEYKEVARAYVRFRYKKEVAREVQSTFFNAIGEKLEARNVQNQNANVDEHSFGGRIGEASGVMTKQYALDNIVSNMAKANHLNNEIYIHDLDSYAVGMHNCLSIPFDDLLANGFNTRQTDVRPANSINTAFQLVAVIFQLQSLQQFGGVSATHLDWTMIPYVRKSFTKHMVDGMKYCENKSEYKLNRFLTWLKHEGDGTLHFDNEEFKQLHPEAWQYAMDMTVKETYQAVEGMYHNLNTLQSRSGNQLPFTSINYGTCTLSEGRLVIKALLDVSIGGIGKLHMTSIFPCGIFQCMKGVNREPGDPNYDLYQLATESTAKRLYPNYANVDWSGNAGYDRNDPRTYFSTMGCRTANGWDVNAEPGQNGQLKDGRGNICPVTIILPTLAMEAKESMKYFEEEICIWNEIEECYEEWYTPYEEEIADRFIEILDKKIDEAKDMLIERFNWICSQDPGSAKFMYENGTMYGYKPEEGIRSALKHGTLAIGQLGLAETLQILVGCDHTEEMGMELAKRIEQLFKDKCAKFKEEYKLNFGVYYTPAENLCYTAMKKFKAKYGIIPEVSDKDFFTNSMHVPVWKRMSPFDKIDIESQLTGYSSAGCITYVELSDIDRQNLAAVQATIDYAMDHDIPYFAINVPCDTCMDCGDCGEIENECPKCGSTNIQRLRRVTGYLTGDYKKAFNKGKQQECEMRAKHNLK